MDFFENCTDQEAHAIILAMLHFSNGMPVDSMPTQTSKIVWGMIQSNLVRDVVDRENGRKGGESKGKKQDSYKMPNKTIMPHPGAQSAALKAGFTEEDSEIIGRLGHEDLKRVLESICVCEEKQMCDIKYFMGVYKNKVAEVVSPEAHKKVRELGYTI